MKNLVYFCYIRDIDRIDKSTQLGISSLRHYKDVFDGQRIIYVAADVITEEFREKSKSIFDFFDYYEIYFVNNHPHNRESEHFIESLRKIKNTDTMTFYAHNKGSTHDFDVDALDVWIWSMFFFNLEPDYLNKSMLDLENKVFSGIFRKIYQFFGADWHYSGAFFWFNTKRLFEKPDWQIIEKGRMGLESYPGRICTVEESDCPFEFSRFLYISTEGDFAMNAETFNGFIRPDVIGIENYDKFNICLYNMKNNLFL